MTAIAMTVVMIRNQDRGCGGYQSPHISTHFCVTHLHSKSVRMMKYRFTLVSNIYTLECSTDVKRDLLMYASIIETSRSSGSMPLRLYHPIIFSDHKVKAGNRLHIES